MKLDHTFICFEGESESGFTKRRSVIRADQIMVIEEEAVPSKGKSRVRIHTKHNGTFVTSITMDEAVERIRIVYEHTD